MPELIPASSVGRASDSY